MKSKVLAILAVGLLAGPTSANALFIDPLGREWLDMDALAGYSWNQVSTICDPGTGVCTGSLASIDLTGYVWATRDEVRQVMYDASGLPAGSLDDDSEFTGASTGFAPLALANLGVTHSNDFVRDSGGWTRTQAESGRVYTAFIIDWLGGAGDEFGLYTEPPTVIQINFSAWLYRPSQSVPEPGTLALLGLGLAGLGFSRRKKLN